MLTHYIVERDIAPTSGRAADSADAVIARARRLLAGVGTGIVWVESFVAGSRACTVCLATDERLVHA